MRSFCFSNTPVDGGSSPPSRLPACACLRGSLHAWGNQKLQDLLAIQALQVTQLPLKCVWGPCQDPSGVFLVPPNTAGEQACPKVADLCVAIAQNVAMKDVSAGSIAIAQCIQARSLKAASEEALLAAVDVGARVWWRVQPIRTRVLIITTCVLLALVMVGGIVWLSVRSVDVSDAQLEEERAGWDSIRTQ
jgi:hypothetical protein